MRVCCQTDLDGDEEEYEAEVDEVLVGEGEHQESAQQALLRRTGHCLYDVRAIAGVIWTAYLSEL